MSTSPTTSATSALIELKGSNNLHHWAHFLKVELEAEELAEHVIDPDSSHLEPDEYRKSGRYYTWKAKRAKAMRILCSTLKREEVINRLDRAGWDYKNEDPAYVYLLVWKVFGPEAPNA